MGALKNIGYLVAAVALLAALFSGAVVVIIIGTAIGIFLKVVVASFFTATAIKTYFDKPSD